MGSGARRSRPIALFRPGAPPLQPRDGHPAPGNPPNLPRLVTPPAKRRAKKAAKKGPTRLTKKAIVAAAKTPAPKKKRAGRPKKGAGVKAETLNVDAVTRDLEQIAKRAPGLDKSALAASALTLARELDTPSNSATSKSMCARVLLDTLDRLRELAPEEEPQDGLDDLRSRRAARTAGRTGTAG